MSITSQDNASRTRPHRRVERILDRLGISYQSEHGEFRPYSLDVWLPEWWAALEVDGPTHSKVKDAKRDADLLTRYGVKVLHLPTNEMGLEHLEITILSFIKHVAKDAQERRQMCRDA